MHDNVGAGRAHCTGTMAARSGHHQQQQQQPLYLLIFQIAPIVLPVPNAPE